MPRAGEGLMQDLDGRVAFVTGGSRGIGRAVCVALARRGANVAFGYFRNGEAARETTRSLEDEGVKAVALKANVADEAALDRAFDQLGETFGRLDVFVSNAASGVIKPLPDLDERAWRWTMDANARAFYLGGLRARTLMDRGGTMVAMSSGGAGRVLPGYAVVGASKAAIEAVARYMAVEFAADGIRVNVVSPGVVDTEALRHFPMRREMLEAAGSRTPAGRLVTPDDVARTVDFLTSQSSEMVTGQVITIDGGAGLLA